MSEKNRFSIDPSEMPYFIRGLGDLISSMQQDVNEVSDNTLFAIDACLQYFADDLEQVTDDAFHAQAELSNLKQLLKNQIA